MSENSSHHTEVIAVGDDGHEEVITVHDVTEEQAQDVVSMVSDQHHDHQELVIMEDSGQAGSSFISDHTEYVSEEAVELQTEMVPSGVRLVKVMRPIEEKSRDKSVFVSKSQKMPKAPTTKAANFQVAMGNTRQSQQALRCASMKSSSLLSLMASVAAQSALASARNSKMAGESKPEVHRPEPTVNEAWHEQLKAVPFNSILEEDVVNWINVESIQRPEGNDAHWMLNPCRRLCVFVNFSIDRAGRRAPHYLCNFCKLTETSHSGILQHLNHHLFVCGTCPYYSSTRFDVELHRQRVGHMQPLSDGYIVHKQGTSVSTQKISSHKAHKPEGPPLIDWLPIQEETESLIIMDSDKPPVSARRAFFRCNPLATATEIKALDISTSVVCALPYYRFVPGKSNRKHVLEFHCNFCQSTPAFTQELYRHIDFHALDCPSEGCDFRSFTRLELHLHQRTAHTSESRHFLADLVMLIPLMTVPEHNLVENASMYHAKWSVVLKLPNIAEVPSSGDMCDMRNMMKEQEYRCTICNLFTINKGGMASHLKMHNVTAKDIEQYIEPV